MKPISKTQAIIISDLITVLVEAGKYHSVAEARADFVSFFAPSGQQSMLEEPFSIKDLTYSQAEHAIDLYRHIAMMPSYCELARGT